MANANYAAVTAATAYSGLAYVAEQSVGRRWATQYNQKFPFLSKLMKRSGQIQSVGVNSYKLIMPVYVGAMVVADFPGVTRANELTAASAVTTSNATQAEVPAAYYRSLSLRFSQSELDMAKNGNRGDIVTAKVNDLQDVMMRRIATDLYDGGDAGQNSIISIPFVLATANTVHGIDQATYTAWQGNVDTTGGAFDLEKFIKHLNVLSDEKDAMPDFAVFSANSGGADIYTRVTRLLSQDVQVMTGPSQSGTLSTGYERFVYRGVEFVRDHHAPAGEVYILDSSSWVFAADSDKPRFIKNLSPLDSTAAYETMLDYRCALGCNSPRRNYRWTGITS